MTNTAEQLDVEELPAGGIGDFIMSDEDFRVLERQNAEKEYGSQGIARFEETAARIAAYGRFGDDQVVHVETGELVVPRKLIEQSPELKESIFRHLREAGIEDPERYVVGSAENSINPETGLMEFGFFSKIFKGIKKAVKSVGKVLKKAAPLILAIAAPYALPAMAPAFATALGSGVGTLIQGGSLKDAFKSALLAGGTYGVFSGAKEAMGGGSFAEGFGGAFKAPELVTPTVTDLSMTPEPQQGGLEGLSSDPVNVQQVEGIARDIGIQSPDLQVGTQAGGDLTGTQATVGRTARGTDYLGRLRSGTGTTQVQNLGTGRFSQSPLFEVGKDTLTSPPSQLVDTGQISTVMPSVDAGIGSETLNIRVPDISYNVDPTLDPLSGGTVTQSIPEVIAESVSTDPTGSIVDATRGSANTFLGNLREAGSDILQGEFRGSLTNLKEAFMPNFQVNAAIEASGGPETWKTLTEAQKQPFLQKAAQAGVSTMDKVIGYAPAALGFGAATGFFETPPMEEAGLVERDAEGNVISGLDLIEQNPFRYRVYPTGFTPTYIPPSDALVPYTPPQRAAEGGEIFPRRTGGIMPDEGIPNEDSVKAMLMPGEFVMTTTAVRGLGDGDLKKGINNMYSVMRNLEARGRATA